MASAGGPAGASLSISSKTSQWGERPPSVPPDITIEIVSSRPGGSSGASAAFRLATA